jgi:hypothetical protein
MIDPEAKKRAQTKYRMKSAPKDQYKRARRRHWLTLYKEAVGCSRCGYNENARALDFDHIDSTTKLFTIGNNYTRNLKILFTEIRKCVIVCANCHRIKSHEEQADLFRKQRKYVH